jgi:diketogulonate reductase-like aldo/keto reductase
MPSLHLGVYLMTSSEASTAVTSALHTGYRAFDSAQMYHNERAVGSSILSYLAAHPELKREEIFYTTKIASNDGYEDVRKGIKQSVRECGLGYVDLLLVHSPYGGKKMREESWRAVEDAIDEGEVKMGGVSNYGEKHVSELKSRTISIFTANFGQGPESLPEPPLTQHKPSSPSSSPRTHP